MNAMREELLSFNRAFTLLTVTLLIQVLPVSLKAGKGEGVTFYSTQRTGRNKKDS